MPQLILDTFTTQTAVDVAGTRSYPNVGPNTGSTPAYPYSSKNGSIKIESSGFITQNFSAGSEGVIVYPSACGADMAAQATFTYDGSATAAYYGVSIGCDATTPDYTVVELRWVTTGNEKRGYFEG